MFTSGPSLETPGLRSRESAAVSDAHDVRALGCAAIPAASGARLREPEIC